MVTLRDVGRKCWMRAESLLWAACLLGITETASAQFIQRRTTPPPGAVVQPRVISTEPEAPPAPYAPPAYGVQPAAAPSYAAPAPAPTPPPPSRRPLTPQEQRYARPLDVAAELRGAPQGGSLRAVPEMLASVGQSARTCFEAARVQSPGLESSASFRVTLRQGGLVEEVRVATPTAQTRHGSELVTPGPDVQSAVNGLMDCVSNALRSFGFQSPARSMFEIAIRMATRELTPGERAVADGRACVESQDWACVETALRNGARDRQVSGVVDELRAYAQSELTTALGNAVGAADVAGSSTERAAALRKALETARRYRAITSTDPIPTPGAIQARLREAEEEVRAEEAQARAEERRAEREEQAAAREDEQANAASERESLREECLSARDERTQMRRLTARAFGGSVTNTAMCRGTCESGYVDRASCLAGCREAEREDQEFRRSCRRVGVSVPTR